MPVAPRDRPPNYTLMCSLQAHIRARPSAVFTAIADRFRPDPASDIRFLEEPRSFFVVVQGSWWYRAEYRVVPDDHGSHIEHSILNVAQRAHRLGAVTGRRVIAEAPAQFERLVRELRLELE